MTAGPALCADPARVTPAWLTEVLRTAAVTDDAAVTAVRRERIGTGLVGQNVRFHLTWDSGAATLPRTVVAKFPSPDAVSRARGVTGGEYEREVRFYQRLAARARLRVPVCHLAALDETTGDFVIVLEDLAPARPGDQLTGCDLDQARAALREAAALHAAYWDDPALDGLPYLRRLHAEPEPLGAFLTAVWPDFVAAYGDALPPGGTELGARFVRSVPAWAAAEPEPRCLAHGDFRIDNMMFGARDVTVVDWQTIQQSAAAADVAYFIGASLPAPLRRAHEDELLHGYHEALCGAGVTGYPLPRLRADYRHATLAGVVLTIGASMLVTADTRGRRMFSVMAERHFTHALDTGVEDFL